MEHTNPTKPRYDSNSRQQQSARAPYNFVPLPAKVVYARPELEQDQYHKDGVSGWIECELVTCSPTYVRGMLTLQQFKDQVDKKADELTVADKKARAPFFSRWQEEIAGFGEPEIPGSSLRGMIRQLVEIVAHGHMRWVADEPTFTFRAVAAAKDDPLRDPYQDVLGRFGANVRTGYLKKHGDAWYIQPAKTPRSKGWPESGAYLKVKERVIDKNKIPGFVPLNGKDYHPQWYPVRFDITKKKGKRGSFVHVDNIRAFDKGSGEVGILVTSGNMLETGSGGQRSPRKNHALILVRDPRQKALRIEEQAIRDYLAGLSPFQREELKEWGGEKGVLKDGAPAFYVAGKNGTVTYFGHSPNFRIPARLARSNRAATPRDFVPENLLKGKDRPDIAERIFGWVEELESGRDLTGQAAGRVFFGNARFTGATNGVWHRDEPKALHVLAQPKPTTFQHYLVQDKKKEHDPDRKESLAHYGTPPSETQIRGYKNYWHKGEDPDIYATAKEVKDTETQLTRVVPLKPGVSFAFDIRFENLREEELGALLWALSLPGDETKTYRHKLGMGKPLGMGAAAITPKLTIIDRVRRYGSLLDDQAQGWQTGADPGDVDKYIGAFEAYLLEHVLEPAESLEDLNRIRMLLAMLAWREGDDAWRDQTRYMEIEYGSRKVNEYTQRPVLPDPLHVAGEKRTPRAHSVSRSAAPARRDAGFETGTVEEVRGTYGFIRTEGSNQRIFIHQNELPSGVKRLREGQKLEFRIKSTPKGLQAIDVRMKNA